MGQCSSASAAKSDSCPRTIDPPEPSAHISMSVPPPSPPVIQNDGSDDNVSTIDSDTAQHSTRPCHTQRAEPPAARLLGFMGAVSADVGPPSYSSQCGTPSAFALKPVTPHFLWSEASEQSSHLADTASAAQAFPRLEHSGRDEVAAQQCNEQLLAAAAVGNVGLARRLLRDGASPHATDSQQHASVLHWAVFSGSKELAEILLLQGADRDAQDAQGCTAKQWAQQWQRPELESILR